MDEITQVKKPTHCRGRRGKLPLGDVARPNPQLFTEKSAAINEAIDGPFTDTYFNSRDPNLQILTESPVHRTMLALRVNGSTVTEIAKELGYSIPHVSQVLRQPWAKKRMLEMQKESSVGTLTARIERIGNKALSVIEEILDDHEVPANVKSTTAQYAVNRLLGRPTDSIVINDNRKASDLTNEELEQIIAKELAKNGSAGGDDAPTQTEQTSTDAEAFLRTL